MLKVYYGDCPWTAISRMPNTLEKLERWDTFRTVRQAASETVPVSSKMLGFSMILDVCSLKALEAGLLRSFKHWYEADSGSRTQYCQPAHVHFSRLAGYHISRRCTRLTLLEAEGLRQNFRVL